RRNDPLSSRPRERPADMDFDDTVKLRIYSTIVATARVPDCAEIAGMLGEPAGAVQEALTRLAARRLLVLERDSPARIRMAPPFAAGVPTSFLARSGGKTYFANCVWDALGVPAALQRDALGEAGDGATNEPLALEVRGGSPLPSGCTAHFAVPAAHWWDDIV